MPEHLAQLLAELPQLAPWAAVLTFLGWLVSTKALAPLRAWLWAGLFDRLLRARGVDERRRHAILVAAASKAQDIAAPDLPTLPDDSRAAPVGLPRALPMTPWEIRQPVGQPRHAARRLAGADAPERR